MRVASSSRDYSTRIWPLSFEDSPLADLELLAQVLSSRKLDEVSSLAAIGGEERWSAWMQLRSRHPDWFTASQRQVDVWLDSEAERFVTLGRTLAAKDRRDESLAAFRNAVELRRSPLRHLVLGDALAGQRAWEQAEQQFRAASKFRESPRLQSRLGGALAAQRKFREAVVEFRNGARVEPNQPVCLYWSALSELADNDRAAYRRTCAELLSKYGTTHDAEAARWAVWSSVLGPAALDDYTPAIELAQRFSESGVALVQHRAGLLFRSGQFAEALPALTAVAEAGAIERSSTAYIGYLLAMTHWRLGNHDDARAWLDRANTAADTELKPPNSVDWNRKLTLELFRGEAEQMMAPSSKEPMD
jgi:tetratricopeptide (TPR) repeat protein